jgi:hypothetical protein
MAGALFHGDMRETAYILVFWPPAFTGAASINDVSHKNMMGLHLCRLFRG